MVIAPQPCKNQLALLVTGDVTMSVTSAPSTPPAKTWNRPVNSSFRKAATRAAPMMKTAPI